MSQQKYNENKKTLEDVIKKLINYEKEEERGVPTNETKTAFISELICAYNTHVSYANSACEALCERTQKKLCESINNFKFRLLRALQAIGFTVELPIGFHEIDIEKVVTIEEFENEDSAQIFISASASNSAQTDLTRATEEQNKGAGKIQTAQTDSTENRIPDPSNQNFISGSNTIDSNQNRNNQRQNTMTLSFGDILKAIPNFSSKNQDAIDEFIANVEMIHTLARDQQETVLMIIRTRLTTAHKLGNISNSTWAEIKEKIRTNYRLAMSFQAAQEKLLAIQQNKNETIDAYAMRIKTLLDALNMASKNDNADAQAACQQMNEELAVRKFKQNIFDEKIRFIALSMEHKTLSDAIAHATEKLEQVKSSNVIKNIEENKKIGNNQNGNGQSNKNKSKFSNRDQCTHCKKFNHKSDQCFFRPKNGQNGDENPQKFTNTFKKKSTNSAAVTEEVSSDDEQQQSSSNSFQQFKTFSPLN